ncbi:NUDIX domain-containing protein [Actinomadura sp. NPDC049753]|uniref:NUDIX hydrolase n=1 Tax=Actinomadura sp. NPDC049753 TaxID=3154739 RepID=UPI0034154195
MIPGSGARPAGVPAGAARHREAVSMLLRWSAPSGEQERLRAEFLEHLAGHPDGTDRGCGAGHLTVGVVVLDRALANVLLTHHRGLDRWAQLGGHCETGDPDLIATARREAAEESGIQGIDVEPSPIRLERYRARCRGRDLPHFDVQFAATAPPRAVPVPADGRDEARWFPVRALPSSADESTRGLVRLALGVRGLNP